MMNKQQQNFLAITAISGILAVGLGAFGAHALQATLEATGRTDTYKTAVLYHFIHTLALLGIVGLVKQLSAKWLIRAGWAFITGIILFSGSLYFICFTGITIAGIITPIGGIFFIVGWLFILFAARKA